MMRFENNLFADEHVVCIYSYILNESKDGKKVAKLLMMRPNACEFQTYPAVLLKWNYIKWWNIVITATVWHLKSKLTPYKPTSRFVEFNKRQGAFYINCLHHIAILTNAWNIIPSHPSLRPRVMIRPKRACQVFNNAPKEAP